MKKLLIVILSLLNLNLHAQERESRDLAAFTGIRAAEGIDVYVKKGSKHLAEIVASGVSTSSIITDVSGGTLRIHMREGTYRSRSVKVYVTYVELEKLMASSGANIFTEDIIKSTKMHMSASSGADIEAKVNCEDISLEASSGGEIVIEGKTKKIQATASSAGDIDAYRLEAEIANAKASSGASVKLNVSLEIQANASSGGSIRYRGSPERTNSNSSSGGSVKKTN